MLPSKEYLSFILFKLPNNNLELSILMNTNSNSIIADSFEWDVNNKTLKEMQSISMSQLKIAGTTLPLYGPIQRYNVREDVLYRESFQGVLLNVESPLPRGCYPISHRDVLSITKDHHVLNVYESLYNNLQNYITRKAAGH